MDYGEVFKVEKVVKRESPIYTMTLIGKNGRVCSTKKVRDKITYSDIKFFVMRCKVVKFKVYKEYVHRFGGKSEGQYKYDFPIRGNVTIVEI